MQTIVKYFVALFLLLLSQFFQDGSEKNEIANSYVITEQVYEWPSEEVTELELLLVLEC